MAAVMELQEIGVEENLLAKSAIGVSLCRHLQRQ